MRTHAFRLRPGQDLRAEIERVVAERQVQAGVILSGVGGLGKVHVRMAGAKGFFDADGEFEIVSLTGTVSVNGAHLHLAIADDTGKTIGGHLSTGNLVRNTAEIVIGEVSGTFRREPDSDTGYDELVVEK